MKLTLVFKNLRIFLMKLEELHVKQIKEDERKLDGGEKKMKMKKMGDGSRESKKKNQDV